MLSHRGKLLTDAAYPLMEGFALFLANPFDPTTNPSGCINLGTAESSLLSSHLSSRLRSILQTQTDAIVIPSDLAYADFTGIPSFRTALCSLFRSTNLHDALKPEQLCVMNGCGTVVETLLSVLCDAKDSVLIPAPYYGGFDKDIEQRFHCSIVPIPTSPLDSTFSISSLDALYETHGSGRIKALVVMNPVNPTGHVYPPSFITSLMSWCRDRKIHLIVDEIYAYSIFKPSPFQSVLTLPAYKEAEEYVHWVWGFSKDFAMNGYRVGVLGTKNEGVLKACKEAAYFTGMATLVQRTLGVMVSDAEWVRDYIARHQEKLRMSCEYVETRLRKMNDGFEKERRLKWSSPTAGFFLWVDVSDWIKTKEEEKRVFVQLAKEGVYMAPGEAFHSPQPGWFRIIFSHPVNILDLALNRFEKVLSNLA